MKFKLEINLDNAAFADFAEDTVGCMLRDMSRKLTSFAGHDIKHNLSDVNGNTVGHWLVTKVDEPDPAASFGAAMSAYKEGERIAKERKLNLSELFNGVDQFMRQCMEWGTQIEEWSCRNVNFEHFPEVWPYFLEDEFGVNLFEMIDITTPDLMDRRLTDLELSNLFTAMCRKFNFDRSCTWDGYCVEQ